jgi:hypothetical protein
MSRVEYLRALIVEYRTYEHEPSIIDILLMPWGHATYIPWRPRWLPLDASRAITQNMGPIPNFWLPFLEE